MTAPNTRQTMKALVLMEPGCLRLGEVAVPEPGPGEVLVRVRAATTCGTDLKAFLRGHPQIPMPGVLGHEYSGDVAAVGSGAPFQVGQAVMGVHSAPCQECRWCRAGQENLCSTIMSTKVLGSYAEYLLVPERVARVNLFEKPESLDYATASLLEPLACVAQALIKAPPKPTDQVVVVGPGAIGLLFVTALRRLGVEDVTLVGRNRARLAVGRQMGARTADLENFQAEADLVVECTGKVVVWERSVDWVRRGGTVVLFGGPPAGSKATWDTKRLHYDEITLVSPFHFGTAAVRQAREWLLDPDFDVSPLLSGTRSLQQGPEVFKDLEAGLGVKYVFLP
ncbi:MAG: alcohol dehydrogenase catalytic domain-containing protein [Fimbriimonadaceae bacterium]|nr:alcohol dehydrogenase catalytic domain-containing protein [Fimbriimonadaceae bacterium]